MRIFSLITSKSFLPLLVVLFFGMVSSRTLLFEPGYFNMHDDLQMMRQLELEKCFLDGQIPCRWTPDMAYGFGFGLFNFYPPLPYFVGEVYRVIGFSFVDTVKLTFATALILSGVFMYFFSKEFFGKLGGVISSVFYIWAPYHAVDIYVRGAMNESWALVFFPLICFSAYKLISDKTKGFRWIVLLALSYFGLFTSHNLMLMIFTPVFVVFVLILLWQHNAWRKIPSLLIAGAWSLGLSAFFTFPALLENKYTQIAGQLVGYYDYSVHFVTIRQLLFSTFWDYGPSVWLEEDGMSFQIGYVHWILSLVVAVLLLTRFLWLLRSQKSDEENGLLKSILTDRIFLITGLFFFVGWFAAFMTHGRSTPLWIAASPLTYLQFPWRFLSLVIFAFSFVAGAILGIIADWKLSHKWFARLAVTPYQILLSALLIFGAVFYSFDYFLPPSGHMGPLTDEQKFEGHAWDLQQTAGIYDYLPHTSKTAPKAPKTVLSELIEGEGALTGLSQGTYWAMFDTDIESETGLVRINILDFPGWKVFMDGAEIPHFIPEEEEWGRIYITVPSGNHKIYTQFLNTPIRTASNIVSVFSWGILLGIFVLKRKEKQL